MFRTGPHRLQMNVYRQIHIGIIKYKTIPSNLKGKSKGSQEWLTRHLNDPFVKKAQELNYRARSAFKLIEIDDRFKILKKGMKVIECGAAPGAWSQVVVDRINSDGRDPSAPKGKVIGIDLLPIQPLPGAVFLSNSDFTKPEVQNIIRKELLKENVKENNENLTFNVEPDTNSVYSPIVDLILSDMAPNASGIPDFDQVNLCKLVESCLVFALEQARPRSKFVAKVYQGSELEKLELRLKSHYKVVHRVKPKSSRENSAELYLVALGLNR